MSGGGLGSAVPVLEGTVSKRWQGWVQSGPSYVQVDGRPSHNPPSSDPTLLSRETHRKHTGLSGNAGAFNIKRRVSFVRLELFNNADRVPTPHPWWQGPSGGVSLSGNIWGDDGTSLSGSIRLTPVFRRRPPSVHTLKEPCTVTACFTLPATPGVTCAPLVSCPLPPSAP